MAATCSHLDFFFLVTSSFWFSTTPASTGPQHKWSISSLEVWMTTLSSSRVSQGGDSCPKVGHSTVIVSAGLKSRGCPSASPSLGGHPSMSSTAVSSVGLPVGSPVGLSNSSASSYPSICHCQYCSVGWILGVLPPLCAYHHQYCSTG